MYKRTLIFAFKCGKSRQSNDELDKNVCAGVCFKMRRLSFLGFCDANSTKRILCKNEHSNFFKKLQIKTSDNELDKSACADFLF